MTQTPEVTITVEHTVKHGENLSQIAHRAGKTVEQVLDYNPVLPLGFSPSLIYPDEIFVVHKEILE